MQNEKKVRGSLNRGEPKKKTDLIMNHSHD